jgi:hypothetical protein
MKPRSILLLFATIALLLQGCYWYETLTVRVNLANKTGIVEMNGISSLPDKKKSKWTKADIKADWESFLKDYNERTILDSKHMQLTDQQLNDNNGSLNAVLNFSFNDISDLDIIKSPDNTKLLMKKGPNDKVIETNGTTMMIDSVEYISWSIDAKELLVKYRMIEDKDKHYSLVKHYRKWKKGEKQ